MVHLESSFGVKSDLVFLHWYYIPDPNASNLGHFRLGICDERFPIYIISVPFSSELNPTRNNSRKVESRLALKNKSFVLTLWFPIFFLSISDFTHSHLTCFKSTMNAIYVITVNRNVSYLIILILAVRVLLKVHVIEKNTTKLLSIK